MKLSRITYLIEQMDSEQLFELNNIYFKSMNREIGEIFVNNEEFFNCYFADLKPFDIVDIISRSSYDIRDIYVSYYKNGFLGTSDYIVIKNLCDSVKNISLYVRDNFEKFQHLFN